jgi:hypothetical protein
MRTECMLVSSIVSIADLILEESEKEGHLVRKCWKTQP